MLSTLNRLRTAAVVGLLGIAVTHAAELPDKLEESEARYQAALFVALIAGCIVVAAVAKRWPERPWWTGVMGVSAPPFVAYIISRTVGLPGGEDDIGAWGEPAGIASLIFEAATVVVAAKAMQLLAATPAPVPARSRAARGRVSEPEWLQS